MVSFLVIHFAACSNTVIENLTANHYLKKANFQYRQERYKTAMEYYEKALQLNPGLKKVYFHLGSCCAMLFDASAGKTSERNRVFGKKAIEYYQKAKHNDPGNKEIDLAMGYIYDRIAGSSCADAAKQGEYFKKAETCYLSILETNPDDPQVYYALANFYSKYGKSVEAEAIYQKRIALNPYDPGGYRYYANYLRNRRQWDRAINILEKRIFAILDPGMIKIRQEIEDLKKKQLFEEMKMKTRAYDNRWKRSEQKIKYVSGEQRKRLSEVYYELGVYCWAKSYHAKPGMMSAQERLQVTQKGIEALEKAARLDPEEPNPWIYMGLMYRQMIIAEPLKNNFYMKRYEVVKDKYLELRKKRRTREALSRML
jgi:tetratricopeptide (TPR) repeat protein